MAVYFVAMGMAYEYVCSLAAVLLHECAHGFVAKKFGYELNVIRLMPYGAALGGAGEIRPKHEAVIALAGPAINLVFALVFAALWWLLPSSYAFTEAFCVCNLCIGVFNLLPVYPLDGGRIAFAALSSKLNRKTAYKIMRIISAVFGLVTLGLFGLSFVYAPNLCLLSVGIFMVASALIPDRRAQYTSLFAIGTRRDMLKNPTEVRSYAVSENAELGSLISALDPERYSEFIIVGKSDASIRGKVSESEVIDAVKRFGYTVPAGQLLENRIVKLK